VDDYLEPGSLTWRQADALRRLLPEGTRIEHLSRWEAAGLIRLHSPTPPGGGSRRRPARKSSCGAATCGEKG
jgi:hypothetical protein